LEPQRKIVAINRLLNQFLASSAGVLTDENHKRPAIAEAVRALAFLSEKAAKSSN